jgi:hypothetical protein
LIKWRNRSMAYIIPSAFIQNPLLLVKGFLGPLQISQSRQSNATNYLGFIDI